MELMTVIADREQAAVEAQRQAEGRRGDETPLQRLTQRITARAKGRAR